MHPADMKGGMNNGMTKGDMMGNPKGEGNDQNMLPANQPAQENDDKRHAYPKREETVSKLTP